MSRNVLIVDDSIFMRRLLGDIVNKDEELDVIGFGKNGVEAVVLNKELEPDVILLDIEMPVLNGIDALELIMKERPCPVVIFSSLSEEAAEVTVRALELGA